VRTTIPGPLIRDRIITLTVCSRHGRPQTHRIRFTAESSPPGWSYALIPAGMLFFWLARVLTRARIDLSWPFCDSCRRRRRAIFALAALQAGMIVALLAHSTSYESPRTGASITALAFIPLVTGYLTLYWSRFQVIAQVKLNRETLEVQVNRPAAALVVEADMALRALAESGMTQQAAPPQPSAPPATVGPMGWRVPS
jgi:hypothetical protein